MLKNTDFILTLTAFAGFVAHSLTTAGAGWPFSRSADAEDTDSIFWTSDRLSQSGRRPRAPVLDRISLETRPDHSRQIQAWQVCEQHDGGMAQAAQGSEAESGDDGCGMSLPGRLIRP